MATRLAVVNHDPAFLTLLQRAFSSDGYEVRRIRAGIGAHEIVRAFDPAALILDIPRDEAAASWQLLGIVLDDRSLDLIPRVVCVEGDRAAGHAAALHRHGGAILTKPFALADLLLLVHGLVGGPDPDPGPGPGHPAGRAPRRARTGEARGEGRP